MFDLLVSEQRTILEALIRRNARSTTTPLKIFFPFPLTSPKNLLNAAPYTYAGPSRTYIYTPVQLRTLSADILSTFISRFTIPNFYSGFYNKSKILPAESCVYVYSPLSPNDIFHLYCPRGALSVFILSILLFRLSVHLLSDTSRSVNITLATYSVFINRCPEMKTIYSLLFQSESQKM